MKLKSSASAIPTGSILPRELMQRLDIANGEILHVVELAGGGFNSALTIQTWQDHGTARGRTISQYPALQGAAAYGERADLADYAIVIDFHSEQLRRFGGADRLARRGAAAHRRYQDR